MSDDVAKLSSVQTAVAELADRVAEIGEQQAASHHDDVAAGCFEAERSLRMALRRLASVERLLG